MLDRPHTQRHAISLRARGARCSGGPFHDNGILVNRRREIGGIGTAARIVIGVLLLSYGLIGGRVEVVDGQLRIGFQPVPVAIGLVLFPAVVLAWQWLRARRTPSRYLATGPVGTTVNIALFTALVLTPSYAPALAFTSIASLVFYGASMLLAAARGYGGCEVLAISNWILRRDDQVGCLVISPIDALERRLGAGARS